VVFGFVYNKYMGMGIGMRVFYEEREGEVGELLNQVKTNGAAGWSYSRVHVHISLTREKKRERERERERNGRLLVRG